MGVVLTLSVTDNVPDNHIHHQWWQLAAITATDWV